MSEWRCFDSRPALDEALAGHLARGLAEDIARHGGASLAVSGGSTPTGMFRKLSRQDLDWERVWLTLVDERCVPTDSADSNERLLRENLLRDKAIGARFLGLAGACSGGIAAITAQIAALPGPFTSVVLGMGTDGHTASWFPQTANLASLLDPHNPARVAQTDPVTARHHRITLTLSAVLHSREIIVHITGQDKKDLLENTGVTAYPVYAALSQQTTPVSIWWAP